MTEPSDVWPLLFVILSLGAAIIASLLATARGRTSDSSREPGSARGGRAPSAIQ